MTAFLIIIAIALLGITAWQMSKIFDLAKKPDRDTSQVANNKDNRQQAIIMLVFVILFYLGMIYCFWHYSNFYLPEAASAHGSKFDTLMFISLGLIIFVQTITQALLFWFSYKYHGKKGRKALFFADNNRLEAIWTIIPVIVLAGLIIYGLFTWSDIMNFNTDDDPMIVEVYAYQFAWRARYSGEDNVLGKANVRFIEGVNQLGVDESDSYGKDDKIVSELHLPVNKPVLFKFRSQDVLHSAYFPFFRAQMNVVPGMVTQFGFTPTITSEEMRGSEHMVEKVNNINEIRREKSKALAAQGKPTLDTYDFEYFLLCNKICGQAHYNMQMKIVVESEKDFDTWMKEQPTFGDTMAKQNEQEAPENASEEKDSNEQEAPANGENEPQEENSTSVAATENQQN